MSTCPNCAADNASDARFCSECGASLASPCAACGGPLPPGARFCPSCGAARSPADAGGPNERKLVSVLFADVTGSTAIGERLDPEQLRAVMDTFFAAMRAEIEAEGGTVEKFIGDAVMAAFGVPAAHEDDVARALRAALRMQRRLRGVNEDLDRAHGVRLQARIGVNTGEALATTSPLPGEALVTGDVVNTAARLQAAADPGSVLVAERTVDAARGFSFHEVGPLELKGKAAPVRAFRLVAEPDMLPERGIPGLVAPMVGRDRELDLLRSLYGRVAQERRPHLATIYGEAGVGKSRLTREFLAWAERQTPPPLVVRGRCLPYGNGVTYWPLAEILKGQTGILDDDAPELALEKVHKAGRELLTDAVTPDPARATAALAYTIGLEDPDIPFTDAAPRTVRDELHAAWRSYFSALAIPRPVVALIEDIHWADPALLDLLEELADRVEGPVLVLCPSRPDLTSRRPGWGGGRRNASSVALDPLTEADAKQLIRLLLTVDDLPRSVRERILERTEGNPFYLEEVIRSLIDTGSLYREGARWQARPSIGDVDIPDTVQAVIASRIDLLDTADKRVLQAAAVVGRVVWPGPVAELLGVAPADVSEAFRRLEERELVVSRPGSTFAGQPESLFKHILTRDVAYESLPRTERAAAHRAVATWIERTAGERVGEFAELLAYHYATSVSYGEGALEARDQVLRGTALRWLLRASRDARRRLVSKKAQWLAEQAMPLVADELERTDVLEALADAFFEDYLGDLAWRYFREAAFTRARTDPQDPGRVAYLAARACEVPQRWPGSIRGAVPSEAEVEEVMELGFNALPAGDSEARVRLLGVRAGWPFGFPDESATVEELEWFEAAGIEAAEIALRIGRPALASGALDQANAVWTGRGWYGRAIPLWDRRAEVIHQVSDTLEVGDFWAMGAWNHFEVGEYTHALEIADMGLEAVAGHGPAVEIHIRAWRTVILLQLGAWDEALAEFERMREPLDDRRDDPPKFATHAFTAAAMIHHARGDQVASDRLTDLLSGLPEDSGRLYPGFLRLLVMRGELDRASRLRRPATWRVHAADAFEAEAELLAVTGGWEALPTFLGQARAHAALAPAPTVAHAADRLEGLVLLAAGDAASAVPLLEASRAGFADRGVPVERARTELLLARALESLGRSEEAATYAEEARQQLERVGALRIW